MRYLLLLFSYSIWIGSIIGQNLDTSGLKTYQITKLNSKKSFQKIVRCKPCILQFYNLKGQLYQEGVYFEDAPAGLNRTYYPNGKTKQSAHYLLKQVSEQHTNPILKNGLWVYYNEQGDTQYTERWNEGVFIEQSPEQSKSEAWAIDLLLDGWDITGDTLLLSDLERLTLVPRFKNKNHILDSPTQTYVLKTINSSRGFDFDFGVYDSNELIQYLNSKNIHSDSLIKAQIYFNNAKGYFGYHSFYIRCDHVWIPDSANLSPIGSKLTSQSNVPFFLKNTVTGKRIYIDSFTQLQIHYKVVNDEFSRQVSLTGYPLNFSPDTLHIQTEYFSQYEESSDISFEKSTHAEYLDTSVRFAIPLKDISYLRIEPYNSEVGLVISGAILTSGIMLVIGAPLGSIDYKNNSFNFDTYKKLILIGVSAAALSGITAGLLTRRVKYVQLKQEDKGRQYWKIEPITSP